MPVRMTDGQLVILMSDRVCSSEDDAPKISPWASEPQQPTAMAELGPAALLRTACQADRDSSSS